MIEVTEEMRLFSEWSPITKDQAIKEIKEQRLRLLNLKTALPDIAYENIASCSNAIIEHAMQTFNLREDDLR